MKLLVYFRNEYSIPKERSKSGVSSSRKETLGIPLNWRPEKSSDQKDSVKEKSSDETLISPVNQSDDGLFMKENNVVSKKTKTKSNPPRRTSKVKYENKNVQGSHGGSGGEKVYIVYPDSSKGSHYSGEHETLLPVDSIHRQHIAYNQPHPRLQDREGQYQGVQRRRRGGE